MPRTDSTASVTPTHPTSVPAHFEFAAPPRLRESANVRRRLLLLVSIGLNGVLALAWFLSRPRDEGIDWLGYLMAAPGETVSSTVRTNVEIRRLHFHWSELESEDYAIYIANLRAVGCPESTVRDIIVSDIDHIYAWRRRTEVLRPEFQWWRTEPDRAVVRAFEAQQGALEAERRELLTRLLGPAWTPAHDRGRKDTDAFSLAGPVLSEMSTPAKEAVLSLLDEHWRAALLGGAADDPTQAAGASPPPVGALLTPELQAELADLMSAEEFEEFLLRYSPSATALREEIHGYPVSPDEFRAIWRAHAMRPPPAERQAPLVPPPLAVAEQRNQVFADVLGEERFREFTLNRDPLYRELRNAVEKISAPPQLAEPLFAVAREAAAEQGRIEANAQLTEAEKEEALAHLREVHQGAFQRLLGDEFYRLYRSYERLGYVLPPAPPTAAPLPAPAESVTATSSGNAQGE